MKYEISVSSLFFEITVKNEITKNSVLALITVCSLCVFKTAFDEIVRLKAENERLKKELEESSKEL